MKKGVLIILALVFLSGITYALVPNLFPNSAIFPRVPNQEGTLGGIISKILGVLNLDSYVSDGTVVNTEKLGGVTATGYLRSTSPCSPGNIYVGVDASGVPTCAPKSPTLLGDLGRIVSASGTVKVYHGSGTNTLVSTFPFVLQNSDIVDTPTGGEATIIFNDDSLLRLDGDTTIAMDIGEYGSGQQIASVLLENGQVWGRILTLTGSYTVGSSQVVAGVRGTSINLARTGATDVLLTWDALNEKWTPSITGTQHNTSLAIVDSTLADYAASVYCNADGRSINLRAEESIISDGTCPTMVVATPVSTFYENTWINKNTQNDINYMTNLRTLSGGLSPAGVSFADGVAKDTKIAAELTASAPSALEQPLLCGQGNQWYPDYGCQPQGILAIADYTRGDTRFRSTINANGPVTATGIFFPQVSADFVTNGINFRNAGNAMIYGIGDVKNLVGGALSGKTITIELVSPMGTNKTILWLSNQNIVKTNPGGVITCGPVNPAFCDSTSISSDRKMIRFQFNTESGINNFYLGGDGLNIINNTIKRVIIY